jgi:predicted amidophosphoribosyltransferase
MHSELDWTLVTRFPESYWNDGWALSHYSKAGTRTALGNLVHTVKYNQHIKTNIEERNKAADEILSAVKEFIKVKYPLSQRPFNSVVCPPSNIDKIFDLTKYVSSNLGAGGIEDLSSCIRKTRDLPSMKNLNGKQRSIELAGAYEFVPPANVEHICGVLIVDDVLDTGATSREICSLLNTALPKVPRYYLSVTYLMAQ